MSFSRLRIGPLSAIVEIPYDHAEDQRYIREPRSLVCQGDQWYLANTKRYGAICPCFVAYRKRDDAMRQPYPWRYLFHKRTKFLFNRGCFNDAASGTCYIFSETYFIFLLDKASQMLSRVYVFDDGPMMDEHAWFWIDSLAEEAQLLRTMKAGYIDLWSSTGSKISLEPSK